MGYDTKFSGEFELDRPLAPAHRVYLRRFGQTKRMKRDASIAFTLNDPIREAVDLPIGIDGGYYVGVEGNLQECDPSVIKHSAPPQGQPGLWCQWVPSKDGRHICWNKGEKFYNYGAWLEYLILHFLEPWGYVLEGEVKWQGEEVGDYGIICVEDNKVSLV